MGQGTLDRWSDDDEPPARRRGAKAVLKRARALEPEEGNATVVELFPNQSAVRDDATGRSELCRYRMSSLAFGTAKRERSPVCVGDRVRVEAGVIVGRCARRNRLARPAPNARDPLLHVLAANLDLLIVVAAAREPAFTAGIVERFVAAAAAQGIPSALCVNKADLLGEGEPRPWAHFPAAGVPVVEASARDGRGLSELAARIAGKTVAFCGHSGVGKTSLLRLLLGDEGHGRVGGVSAGSGLGRHTTTGACLREGPLGSRLIDTPGVMNFVVLPDGPGLSA